MGVVGGYFGLGEFEKVRIGWLEAEVYKEVSGKTDGVVPDDFFEESRTYQNNRHVLKMKGVDARGNQVFKKHLAERGSIFGKWRVAKVVEEPVIYKQSN